MSPGVAKPAPSSFVRSATIDKKPRPRKLFLEEKSYWKTCIPRLDLPTFQRITIRLLSRRAYFIEPRFDI